LLDNRLTITGKHSFYNYEKIDIADTAIGLTDTILETARRPISVLITFETAPIRWRADSEDPTATEGHLQNTMSSLVIEGYHNLKNIRFIRQGTTSGVARVSYRR
jgi:hypothetical protein